jgi:hypothetical protein
VFAIGATGHTALYRPSVNAGGTGTWTAGPDLPADTSNGNYNQANGSLQTAIDAPAVLLPNGTVVLVAGNTVLENNKGTLQFWSNPANFFVFDPDTAKSPALLDVQPPNNSVDTWTARLLLLPTGQVLFSTQQAALSILTLDPATSAPRAEWKPVITNGPAELVAGETYEIYGTQFNGLSQAVSYGDDAPAATNYPIVRLTGSQGGVYYLRTFEFSTLGVATGSTIHSASVAVPGSVPSGQYDLVVIANGIASDPRGVLVRELPAGKRGRRNLVQSDWGEQGNFELLVPTGNVIRQYFRNNDDPAFPWHHLRDFGYPVPANELGPTPRSVTFIQSNFRGDGQHGNFEAIVRVSPPVAQPDRLDFWWLDSKTSTWHGPFPLTADGTPINGVTGD